MIEGIIERTAQQIMMGVQPPRLIKVGVNIV
jgi:hypothetical protein